jgi:hypothetical protein
MRVTLLFANVGQSPPSWIRTARLFLFHTSTNRSGIVNSF